MTMPRLTRRGQLEVAALERVAADSQRPPIERAAALITAHQRWDIRGCVCGWDQLAQSHAIHVAGVLSQAGLLAEPAVSVAP